VGGEEDGRADPRADVDDGGVGGDELVKGLEGPRFPLQDARPEPIIHAWRYPCGS
jgi:hypothetical protein